MRAAPPPPPPSYTPTQEDTAGHPPRHTHRHTLDSDSLATLIYAVANSRMDYCNTVLAGAPRTVTDKLQRVLTAAARVISGTRKFDLGLGQILHDQLHWLDVPDRVLFKLAVTVHQCLNGRAPPHLSEHCIPVSSADTRRHLRSATVTYLPYRVSGSTLTAVGRSQLLVRWPGTQSVSHPPRSTDTRATQCAAALTHWMHHYGANNNSNCTATNPAGHSPRPPLSGSAAGVFLTVNKRPIHDPPTPNKKFRLPVRSCPSSAQDVYLSVNNHFHNFFKTRSTVSQRRTLVSSPFSHAGTVVRRAGKLRCDKI